MGVSLYELVTGKRPFDGDSQFSIMSAHLEKHADAADRARSQAAASAERHHSVCRWRRTRRSASRPPARFATRSSNVAAPPPQSGSGTAAVPRRKDDFHIIEPTAPTKPGAGADFGWRCGAVAASPC